MAFSAFKKDYTVYDVEYCAYTELRRPMVHKKMKDELFVGGDFEVLTRNGQTGISYLPSNAVADDVNDSDRA